MTQLLTAAQMRAIEQAAIESGEVTGLELMERAGQGVVDAIFEEWPELKAKNHRAVVLCGPGNNGGDGFVIARRLKSRGWDVEVFLYGEADKLPPDAKVNHDKWCELGDIYPLVPGALTQAIDRSFEYSDFLYDHANETEINLGAQTIYVDALFGTGLTRKFDDPLLDISAEWTEECYAHGVAVDIPSGLCSDSGQPIGGNWLFSKLVVTFHAPKVGHFCPPTCYDIRRLATVDLDLSGFGPRRDETVGRITTYDIELDLTGFFGDGLNKTLQTHKYSHGHTLVLSGGVGKGGAARLAARGALRVGAGAVTVGCPPAALIENAAQLNAVMLSAVKDADALVEMLKDGRINALCLGPGLGTGEWEAALVAKTLENTRLGLDLGPRISGSGPGANHGRGLVLDADALTLLSRDEALFAKLHKNCVLTPHAGEFARLFPDISEKLNAPATKGPAYSKVDATREAAKRAGCVVLFKGPDTVIADPSGRCSINASVYERSAPWLATAGSGDVLAGFITGLVARGFAPMQAAETGAWLHTECALSFGPGLIAEDLPEELPKVLRERGL
ncbi:NAD(P)H-hydrate dehydratase [Yoonia sp. 2307UL14-13]|uniref:NAD(P)H-hydrate dehydratase n=1 Tax=Yoonia sp. 2307UL14-13 TaxID=3126506 RepID=UPI0030B72833